MLDCCLALSSRTFCSCRMDNHVSENFYFRSVFNFFNFSHIFSTTKLSLLPPSAVVNLNLPTMSDMLQLWCWVEGDDHKHAFSLNILGTKTVDELKDAIKKKKEPVFDHLPADTLTLWKVSIMFSAPRHCQQLNRRSKSI